MNTLPPVPPGTGLSNPPQNPVTEIENRKSKDRKKGVSPSVSKLREVFEKPEKKEIEKEPEKVNRVKEIKDTFESMMKRQKDKDNQAGNEWLARKPRKRAGKD